MRQVLVLDDYDFSNKIVRKGFEWGFNSLDSEKTTRLKHSGRMRRDKICDKDKIPFTLFNLSQDEFSRLITTLKKPTFTAKYLSPTGLIEGEFYCTSCKATCVEVYEDDELWDSITFTMIEV